MGKIKKIDIHAHVRYFKDYTMGCFCSPTEQIGYYDALGIEKGVILPLGAITNQEAIATVNEHSDRFSWFCNLDSSITGYEKIKDTTEKIEFYKGFGAKGVGEFSPNVYFDDERVDNLFSLLSEYQLPVLFHIETRHNKSYGIIDEYGLPRLEKMLKKHKNLKFIGHSQPFWIHISKDLDPKNIEIGEDGKVIPGRITELMREYENLYCDISAGSGKEAITRDREHAVSFFTEFSDRIFFGTDFCPSVIDINTRPMITFIDDLVESGEIEESVYKKICRENAINILKI